MHLIAVGRWKVCVGIMYKANKPIKVLPQMPGNTAGAGKYLEVLVMPFQAIWDFSSRAEHKASSSSLTCQIWVYVQEWIHTQIRLREPFTPYRVYIHTKSSHKMCLFFISFVKSGLDKTIWLCNVFTGNKPPTPHWFNCVINNSFVDSSLSRAYFFSLSLSQILP